MSTYTPIASVTLTSAQSSVIFSGIPQTYTDLIIVFNGIATGFTNLAFRFNSDTSSNYSYTRIFSSGSSVATDRATSQTLGAAIGITATSQMTAIGHIMNYSNSNVYKTVIGRGSDSSAYVSAYTSLWRNTNAINTIDVRPATGTFNSGSTINIYGVNAQLSAQAKAYGGDTIVTDGTYWYHTFYSSGTFTPTEALTADCLVVAGGGGGGSNQGGGGGAGGLQNFTSQSLTATAYTITVGAGGSAGTTSANGTSGNNSSFGVLTASVGGGRGGGTSGSVAANGGSGGGSDRNTATVATGTAGQGNNGGAAASGTVSSGGGGAGAVGSNGSSGGNGGTGGAGLSTYSSWGSATLTGQNISGTYWYAGGGGGGIRNNGLDGSLRVGGNGGGGTGGGTPGATPPTAGIANTGGGGGGGSANGGQPDSIGAAGGSGIVIVRYAVQGGKYKWQLIQIWQRLKP